MKQADFLHMISKSVYELSQIAKDARENNQEFKRVILEREKIINKSLEHLEHVYKMLDLSATYFPEKDNGEQICKNDIFK